MAVYTDIDKEELDNLLSNYDLGELIDYKGIVASIVEISHRHPIFKEIINSAEKLFRELTNLPNNYKILFMHGGAQMQFSAVPLNLMSR